MNFKIILYSTSALFVLGSAHTQTMPPLFNAPWRAYDTGDFPTFAPNFLAIGDMDGDGDTDVVASREMFSGPGISILRSNGDGSFATEEIYELNFMQSLGDVELADIDGDGDLDVLASIPDANGQTNKLALWRNNGDGTLSSPNFFTTGNGPTGIEVADFTGDGFPDVITADYGYIAGNNNTISFLKHNGLSGSNAGFLAPVQYSVGDNCLRVDSADIDSDGDLDIAIGRSDRGGGINILTNDGSGIFTASTSFEAVPGSFVDSPAVVFADVDNDNDMDLITGGAENGGSVFGIIAVRKNNGAGVFGTPIQYNLTAWTYTPHSIAVSDLNKDGWLDIFVSTPSGRAMDGWNTLMSNGSGGYRQSQFFSAGKQTFDLKAFDADQDGDLDMVTLANDSSVLTVHKNTGGGEFYTPVRYDTGFLCSDMDYGDIDNDGDIDIVTTDTFVRVHRNNSKGGFAPSVNYDPPFGPGETKLRDLNNDGFLDLLIGPGGSGPFATAINNGDGTFGPIIVTQMFTSNKGHIDAFDLDNDGFLDVAVTDTGPAARILLARNTGNGSNFQIMPQINTPGLPWRIEGTDTNGDGNIDLFATTALGITIFPGNGDVSFGDPVPLSEYGFDFVLSDLNSDGIEDLCILVPQNSFGTVRVATMLGFGDGEFSFARYFNGPNGRESAFRISNEIEAADVDGDGQTDLILSNNASNDVSIFLGDGNGLVQLQDRYGTGYSTSNALAADFTGDGLVDIAAVISTQQSGLYNAFILINGVRGDSSGGGVDLINFEVVNGTMLDGGLADLTESDDSYVHTRSGFGETLVDLHNMEMVVSALSTVDAPSILSLSIESRVDQPSGIAQIRLRNWNTTEFVQVGSYSIGMDEQVVVIDDLDATNYIDETGTIDVSIKHLVFVPFLAFTFESFIDHLEITVQ